MTMMMNPNEERAFIRLHFTTYLLTYFLLFHLYSFLTRPSSLVGCRRWGCMDKFLPLLPVFWHVLLPVVYYFLFAVNPLWRCQSISCFVAPDFLYLTSMCFQCFAGNLELFIRITWPNHCSLRLYIFCTSIFCYLLTYLFIHSVCQLCVAADFKSTFHCSFSNDLTFCNWKSNVNRPSTDIIKRAANRLTEK